MSPCKMLFDVWCRFFSKAVLYKQLKCTPPPPLPNKVGEGGGGWGSSRKERVVDEDACIMYIGMYLNARKGHIFEPQVFLIHLKVLSVLRYMHVEFALNYL